jgi:protein involved in polysaccharide export with SLBB domain
MCILQKFLIVPACLLVLWLTIPVSGQERDPESLVHFGDLIDVDVLGGFEFDWRGRLSPEGFLEGFDSYDDPIYGHCRSVDEVAADIAKVFSKILREPRVVVRVIDRSSRPVARLDGAVRTPTRFRILRPVRLRELLVLAGGLTDGASGGISIFRPDNASCAAAHGKGSTNVQKDNAFHTLNIKISDLLSGTTDPQIFCGDLVSVIRADPIYVIGAVNNPRPIYSALEMTISRAVAAAGGPSKGADRRATIYRREGEDAAVIEADLDKIARGEANDAILKPFDILEVTAKGGSQRRYPPVVSAPDGESNRAELPLRVVD